MRGRRERKDGESVRSKGNCLYSTRRHAEYKVIITTKNGTIKIEEEINGERQ